MRRSPFSSRQALDNSSSDHMVNVSVDGDVKDNKSLCQAIVKATGQMLGEISQQIVEFDNERKCADAESARRLMANTDLISKRMAAVEKEILEGQRHMEVMESINLLSQLAKQPNHDPILEAIAAISLQPADMSPVMAEISSVHKKHGKLEELLQSMQDGHSELQCRHGEVLRGQGKLQDLLSSLQDSHSALSAKHAKLLANHGKIEEMLTGLHDGHSALHDTHSELLSNHSQLRDLLQRLQESHNHLHNRHEQLLGAVGNMATPDLGPFHEHFSMVGDALSHHSTKVGSIEHRLQMLEKNEQENKEMLEAILQRLPLDLDKQLKTIQGEMRSLRSTVQQDLGSMSDTVQSDLKSVHKETQQGRMEAADNAAVMEREVRKLQQAVSDATKQTAASLKQHSAELLSAVEQIELGPELEAITGGVIEKLKKVNLRTDHGPVLAALECIPDMHSRMCHVHDKISTSNVHYDHSDVLKAIGKIRPGPDHDVIAEAVHSRISKANLKVDHSELTKALGKLDIDRAIEAHSRDVDSKLRKHSSDIMKAIGNVPDHETIVNAMHERLQSTPLKVDHSELKQLLRRIPTEHDHDALASAVHSRMGSAIASAGNHSKILDAISGLKLDPDLTAVLEAIEAMEESVLTTLLEAIQNIDMQVSCKGALPASVATPRGKDGLKRAAKVCTEYKDKFSRRTASTSSLGLEPGRMADISSQQTTPRSARDIPTFRSVPENTAVPLSARGKADRSSSIPARPSPTSPTATSPEHEVPASEGVLLACMCGYSCGTQMALDRHLARVAGQRGHRPVGP